VDFLRPQSYNLPEGDASQQDEGAKLAQFLRKISVNGNVNPMGQAGTMVQGRAGYQFDPNQEGNNLGVGVAGQGVINNKYNIPTLINGIDVSYGSPAQSISAGYYPNKSEFMGNPVGRGGVSLTYRKTFD
jgi:hypothetical protein